MHLLIQEFNNLLLTTLVIVIGRIFIRLKILSAQVKMKLEHHQWDT